VEKRLSLPKFKEKIDTWGGVPALAAELHVTRQAVYTWLRGERVPPLERMLRIASILECDLEDLLEVSDGSDT